MNSIDLKGTIRRIQPSHTVNGITYMKADLVVPRGTDKEDVLEIKFKESANEYKEGDQISLSGNVRSFSQRISDTRNKVSIYVFTNFDEPLYDTKYINSLVMTGQICKIEPLNYTTTGKANFHFILRNKIPTYDDNYVTCYVPCSVWGRLAKDFCDLQIGDNISIEGELHSRLYKKKLSEGDFEYRTAHEALVTNIQILDEES